MNQSLLRSDCCSNPEIDDVKDDTNVVFMMASRGLSETRISAALGLDLSKVQAILKRRADAHTRSDEHEPPPIPPAA